MSVDVALVQLPYSWYDLDFRLLLLRSWLEHRGVATTEVLRRDPETLSGFVDRILSLTPRVVVLQVGWWGGNFGPAQRRWTFGLADLLAARRSGVLVVACGEMAMWAPEAVLARAPGLDACVTGDAFVVLEALAKTDRRALPIAGTATRRGRKPPPPPLTGAAGAELDVIPTPFAGLATHENYDFTYSTALGCPYGCIYCRTRSYDGTSVRWFSVARAADDLARIAAQWRARAAACGVRPRAASNREAARPWETDPGFISVEDQTFTLDRARTLALCERLGAVELGVPLSCTTRADLMDDELAGALRRGGFTAVSLGIDTLEPAALEHLGRLRRLDLQPVLAGGGPGSSAGAPAEYRARCQRGIEAARGAGLAVQLSAVLGLPGSTVAGDRETVAWVEARGVGAQLNPYMRHPGPLLPPPRPDERDALELQAAQRRVHHVRGGFRTRGGHLVGREDALLAELDSSRPPVARAAPITVVLEGAAVDGAALAPSVSSGAWAYAIAGRTRLASVRRLGKALPLVGLLPEGTRVSEAPDDRIEVTGSSLSLADLVDRRGAVRLERLALASTPYLETQRSSGVRIVRVSGARDLGALARLTAAARRGLWCRVEPDSWRALILVHGGCAACTDAAPRASLGRVYASPEGLRACPQGPVLGAVGTTPAGVDGALVAADLAAQTRRGCAGCAARVACPACACGAGLSDAQYCAAMRGFGPRGPAPLWPLRVVPAAAIEAQRAGAGSVLELLWPPRARLDATVASAWQEELGPAGSAFAAAPHVAVLMRVRARRRHVLVHPGGVVELPPVLARLFAEAQRGATPAALRARLERAGAEPAAARDALRSVLEVATTSR